MNSSPHVDVIILAAGQGKRMQKSFPGVPKVLLPLAGRPMLTRVLDSVESSGAARHVTIVVGPVVEDKVRAAAAGHDVRFAFQPEPKGTGHAVLCARPEIDEADHVLVVYGDQPLISPKTIRALVGRHLDSDADLTMATVPLPDFSGWRSCFLECGRIIRNAEGKVVNNVEAKDATPEEKAITEVNPALYCFRAAWLWKQLPTVGCENSQGEYYLPDLFGIAVREGSRLETLPVDDARETLGANTPEQLAELERIYLEMNA